MNKPGEGLDDVEPIDGDLGVGQILGHAAQEGMGHVADHFYHVVRGAAMLGQEGAEDHDGGLAMTGHGEDHRLVPALHVEEHRDIVLSAS